MIINDDIGKEVEKALQYAKEAKKALEKDDLKTAFPFSRKAFLAAGLCYFFL